MLSEERWVESDSTTRGKPIFVDRDPTCFGAILSYMRSQRVFLAADVDVVELEQLSVEADYYQLLDLSAYLHEEIAKREAKTASGAASGAGGRGEAEAKKEGTVDALEVFKSISPSEVNAHFEAGWAFVSSFEGNECACCSVTGSKIECSWRGNACNVCGQQMSYDKFKTHASFYRPTVIVVKRPRRGSLLHTISSHAFAYGGGSSMSARGGGGGGGGARAGVMSITPSSLRHQFHLATPNPELDIDSSFG